MNLQPSIFLTPFEQGLIAHLVADWLLQNDWMAKNKMNLKHPAAWVHAAIHVTFFVFLFGWLGGILLGILHLLIDSRIPLTWWSTTFRQTQGGHIGDIVAMVGDQILHLLCLIAVLALVS